MAYAKDVAREHVNDNTFLGSASTVLPIPGWHSIVLTAAEARMAVVIAKIYGLKPSGMVWGLILKVIILKLGGSAVLKAAGEGLGTIPVVGWLAKPFVAAATIKLFGSLLIEYFEDKFPHQRAYIKPSFESILKAFGNSIARQELHEYWSSYDDTKN